MRKGRLVPRVNATKPSLSRNEPGSDARSSARWPSSGHDAMDSIQVGAASEAERQDEVVPAIVGQLLRGERAEVDARL